MPHKKPDARAEYRRKNRELINEKKRQWWLIKHPPKAKGLPLTAEEKRIRNREYQQKYLERNKEKRKLTIKASNAKRYKSNPEWWRKRRRDYYAKNRVVCVNKSRQWREQNPDKVRKASSDYYSKNAEKIRLKSTKYKQIQIQQLNAAKLAALQEKLAAAAAEGGA